MNTHSYHRSTQRRSAACGGVWVALAMPVRCVAIGSLPAPAL